MKREQSQFSRISKAINAKHDTEVRKLSALLQTKGEIENGIKQIQDYRSTVLAEPYSQANSKWLTHLDDQEAKLKNNQAENLRQTRNQKRRCAISLSKIMGLEKLSSQKR